MWPQTSRCWARLLTPVLQPSSEIGHLLFSQAPFNRLKVATKKWSGAKWEKQEEGEKSITKMKNVEENKRERTEMKNSNNMTVQREKVMAEV